MDHLLIDTVQFKLLGLNIIYKPNRIIDSGESFDDGRTQNQGMLGLLLLSHLIVHILESGNDSGLTIGQLQFCKLQTIIADTLFKNPPEWNRIDQLFFRVFDNYLRLDSFQKRLPVFFQNKLRIEGKRIIEPGDLHRLVCRHKMDHLLIDTVQFKLLGFNIIYEPDRIIDPGECFDDGRTYGFVRFRLLVSVGDIGNKHIIQSLVGVGLSIMAVIIDPPDRAVLTDNSVFHMVEIKTAAFNLRADKRGDLFIVFRMNHPTEGKSG